MAENLTTVIMTRNDLRDFPRNKLPRPFSIRPYRTGDIDAWVRVQQDADRYQKDDAATFRKWFGYDEAVLARRMVFICDAGGREIGTAAAWYGDGKYEGWARVHWVAIVPDFQGRGLARPLISRILELSVAMGHDKAFLTTESIRIPAINLYQSFGFQPAVENEEDRKVWNSIMSQLKGK